MKMLERETIAYIISVVVATLLYVRKEITADWLMGVIAGSGTGLQLSRGIAKLGNSQSRADVPNRRE